MIEKKTKRQEQLDKAVESKIKGIGLDALFHIVDVSKKDRRSAAHGNSARQGNQPFLKRWPAKRAAQRLPGLARADGKGDGCVQNGIFRGKPSNAAVFVWYAEVVFIDGRVELFKGDVTLVR